MTSRSGAAELCSRLAKRPVEFTMEVALPASAVGIKIDWGFGFAGEGSSGSTEPPQAARPPPHLQSNRYTD